MRRSPQMLQRYGQADQVIRPGDLLTSSYTAGHAMRAGEIIPGTIIGKALEPLQSGTGLIKVLVMPR